MADILCPISGKTMRTSVCGLGGKDSKILSEFKEETILGVGGYGCVVKCINLLDGATYAVKKIKLSKEIQPELDFDRVRREVQAFAKMRHPRIVTYYSSWLEESVEGLFLEMDNGELEDISPEEEEKEHESLTKKSTGAQACPCLYILQEYCPNSLSKLIKQKPAWFSISRKRKIYHQIVEGVQHIHSKGIRHGDLTLKNILLDDCFEAKVADFGVASLKKKGVLSVDSPRAYNSSVAPEIVKNNEYSLASDVFSLGVLMVDLFHEFSTESGRVAAIKDLPHLPDIPALSDSQRDLLENLVQTDPKLRHSVDIILTQLKLEEERDGTEI